MLKAKVKTLALEEAEKIREEKEQFKKHMDIKREEGSRKANRKGKEPKVSSSWSSSASTKTPTKKPKKKVGGATNKGKGRTRWPT